MNSSGPQELKRQHGVIALRHRSIWRHWREPYVFALALSWPGFLALTSGLYLAINLLFAGLYRLDPAGIGGTSGSRASFAEAFFFSVQTLGSIGYGVLHPRGLYTNLIVTFESLIGLLVVAITTGLAFARFSRSNARIRFSQLQLSGCSMHEVCKSSHSLRLALAPVSSPQLRRTTSALNPNSPEKCGGTSC